MLVARTLELKKSRAEKGLSMSALAELVGMSPSGISRIESGAGAGELNAKKISEALGKDVFDLFELKN